MRNFFAIMPAVIVLSFVLGYTFVANLPNWCATPDG